MPRVLGGLNSMTGSALAGTSAHARIRQRVFVAVRTMRYWPAWIGCMPNPVACHARSLAGSFCVARIFRAVLVTARAMRNGGATQPVGRDRSVGRPRASAHILAGGDWLQVMRVYAAPDSAQVVELKTIGNFSSKRFKRKSMASSIFKAIPKSCITSIGQCAHPDPATAFGDDFDVAQESFDCASLVGSHSVSFKDCSVRLVAALIRCAGRSYFTPNIIARAA